MSDVEENPKLLVQTTSGHLNITPDGKNVVFYGNIGTGTNRLYIIPTAGGSAERMNTGTSVPTIHELRMTPDGSHLVFIATVGTHPVMRLYSLAVKVGGTLTTLSTNTGNDTELKISSFHVSPDGQTVLFKGNPDQKDVFKLQAVSVTGGPVATLAIESVSSERISPDGKHVVYKVGSDKLYSVPLNGGSVQELTGTLLNSGGSLSIHQVTRDSKRVVFLTLKDGSYQVHHNAIGGGDLKTVSQTFGDLQGDYPIAVSPDGRYVAIGANLPAQDPETFILDLTVNKASVVGTKHALDAENTYHFSPNSEYVLFPSNGKLLSIELATKKVNILGDHPAEGAASFRFRTTASDVVFWPDFGSKKLLFVANNGGTVTTLAEILEPSVYIDNTFVFNFEETHLVYYSYDDLTPGFGSLQTVNLTTNKTSTIPKSGHISLYFVVSPVENLIVYSETSSVDSVRRLFTWTF